jgi:Putative metal-binding motif
VNQRSKGVTVSAFFKRMNRRTRRVAVIAFVSGVLFVAGVAFAEWLATGVGSGYAKAGTAQNLTTSAVVASETLYPGGTGDLALTVNNPNPYPVTVTSVVGAGPIVSSSAACNAAGHGVTFTNRTGLSLVVPADGTASFALTGSVAMAETSANECQGATFEIPVALTGVSGASGGGGGTDADGDTYASVATGGADCDDADAAIYPGAPELLNAVDDDCDGVVDDGVVEVLIYQDQDGDAYGGDPGFLYPYVPPGFVLVGGDCNDINDVVYPGASEIADLLDNDCDGEIDEGTSGLVAYHDVDLDGFGAGTGQSIVGPLPVGFALDNADCDDTNPAISPAASELPANGVDDNCDGSVDE